MTAFGIDSKAQRVLALTLGLLTLPLGAKAANAKGDGGRDSVSYSESAFAPSAWNSGSLDQEFLEGLARKIASQAKRDSSARIIIDFQGQTSAEGARPEDLLSEDSPRGRNPRLGESRGFEGDNLMVEYLVKEGVPRGKILDRLLPWEDKNLTPAQYQECREIAAKRFNRPVSAIRLEDVQTWIKEQNRIEKGAQDPKFVEIFVKERGARIDVEVRQIPRLVTPPQAAKAPPTPIQKVTPNPSSTPDNHGAKQVPPLSPESPLFPFVFSGTLALIGIAAVKARSFLKRMMNKPHPEVVPVALSEATKPETLEVLDPEPVEVKKEESPVEPSFRLSRDHRGTPLWQALSEEWLPMRMSPVGTGMIQLGSLKVNGHYDDHGFNWKRQARAVLATMTGSKLGLMADLAYRYLCVIAQKASEPNNNLPTELQGLDLAGPSERAAVERKQAMLTSEIALKAVAGQNLNHLRSSDYCEPGMVDRFFGGLREFFDAAKEMAGETVAPFLRVVTLSQASKKPLDDAFKDFERVDFYRIGTPALSSRFKALKFDPVRYDPRQDKKLMALAFEVIDDPQVLSDSILNDERIPQAHKTEREIYASRLAELAIQRHFEATKRPKGWDDIARLEIVQVAKIKALLMLGELDLMSSSDYQDLRNELKGAPEKAKKA